MCEQIVHRGPDDEGLLVDGAVALGMRRLSIIDLASGRQPIHNEDRTVWVVFNGEIYNYRKLRAELEARGHHFYTHSDTECLVHLYEEHGEEFVKRLNGMFSIALWDTRRRRVLLARDRLGEKQLYYAQRDGRFIFGSEIKCLLATGWVERRIDRRSFDRYLRFLYVPAPDTMYEQIKELAPASFVVLEEGRAPRFERYWVPRFESNRSMRRDEAVERVREQFHRSVASRLESDVPLGALLSGGVDSNAVVASMVRANNGIVRTFTIGYGDEGRFYDEREQARVLAERLGTEHHEFVVQPDIVEVLPKIVRAFDQPFADSSAVANYYVFRETSRHVKVVLSGLGGDELFAGYERYLALRLHERVGLLPRWLRAGVLARVCELLPEPRDGGRSIDRIKRFMRASPLPAGAAYLQYVTSFDASQRVALYEGTAMGDRVDAAAEQEEFMRLFGGSGDVDALSGALFADTLTYLPGDLLTLTDRMSMAHSVEARAPFLDPDLVELAASIPARYKLDGLEKKSLLRAAVGAELPAEVLKRAKRGFTIPLTVWLRGELKPLLDELLSAPRLAATGLLNAAAVQRLVDEHMSRRQNHHARLWALLVFMVWHRDYVEG
jgi:asparagine synthase (glutamine-hydrolysing)